MAGGTSLGQVTDVTQIFDLLESNKPEVVQDVKDLILENLNSSMYSLLVLLSREVH